MAVELMGFPKMDEQKVRILSQQPSHLNTDLTDVTVSNFKKVISLLNRTGHARFRRAPIQTPPSTSSHAPPPPDPVVVRPAPASFVPPQSQSLTLDFRKPNNILTSNAKSMELEFSKETFSVSSTSSFLSSAITGDGSVSNGKIFLTPSAPTVSGGKPPLSSSTFMKRCHDHGDHSDDISGKISGSSKCHCVKRRYTNYTILRFTVSFTVQNIVNIFVTVTLTVNTQI